MVSAPISDGEEQRSRNRRGAAGCGGQCCSRFRRANFPKIEDQMRRCKFKLENLRAVGAFEDFMKGPFGDPAYGNDYDNREPSLASSLCRAALGLLRWSGFRLV